MGTACPLHCGMFSSVLSLPTRRQWPSSHSCDNQAVSGGLVCSGCCYKLSQVRCPVSNRNLLLRVLLAGKSEIKVPAWFCFDSGSLLVHSQNPHMVEGTSKLYPVSSHGRKALASLLGPNAIHGGSTLRTKAPPKGPAF